MRYILILALVCCTFSPRAHQITEENYRKADAMIWENYNKRVEELFEAAEKYPDKRDSLRIVNNRLYDQVQRENIDTAIKFAATPGGFQRLFMLRLSIPKDTLEVIAGTVPAEIRDSFYGQAIRMHLDTRQLKEGDKYIDFDAVTAAGEPFKVSDLGGKNVLLLYGGLECMQSFGRDYLTELTQTYSEDSLEIVVYSLSDNLSELQQENELYQLPITLISDFLGDHCPFKIIYGCQATPTCFLIGTDGTILVKSTGLNFARINRALKN